MSSKTPYPNCKGDHTLSQCPTWFPPEGYRLLPVALHPAIENALRRHCFMPITAWQDVIAAADRVSPDARPADSAVQHAIHNLKEYRAGRSTFPGEAIGILERALAAPERSGKTADEGEALPSDWMIVDSLLYRLNEAGVNCDEINVTMAGGSRELAARSKSAQRLFAMLPSAAPDSSDDVPISMSTFGSKEACEAEHRRRAASSSAAPSERVLDLYDEIECDLPALFGRAAKEGHEVGQQLALELRTKMVKARALTAPSVQAAPPPAPTLTDADIERMWREHVVPVFGMNGINANVFARAIEQHLTRKDA